MIEEIFANLLAGLGLFFIGVKFIGEHMRQMAGRGFRRIAARFTGHPALSLLAGLVAGSLVQSATAVTFIMTSMISSRVVTVRGAMPVLAWSNVGSSLLVLLAVLDLRLGALLLLGAAGICHYFHLDKSARFRHWVGALLGLALLLLGLILLKTGAAPLQGSEFLKRFLTYTRNSYLLAFFIGAFVTFIAQSSTTVSVLAITLARVGLLGMEQTLMIIYGANLGSGLSTAMMSSNLKGTPRQLAIFQAVFKIAGTLLFVPLFYAEWYFHLPGMQTLVTRLSPDLGQQMAYAYLAFQLCAAAIVSMAASPIQRLLERLSPATAEEVLTRTQFIYDQAVEEAETALDLVEKEQLRLLCHLPEFLDAVRQETASNSTVDAVTLRKAVHAVGAEVKAFVTDIMDQHQSLHSLERALNLQSRTDVIVAVAETIDDLVSAALRPAQSARLSSVIQRLAEALHLILTTMRDTAETPSDENRQTLLQLTSDRGEMMVRIRRSFLGENALSPAGQQDLMTITTLFERTIWLLRRLAMLLPDKSA